MIALREGISISSLFLFFRFCGLCVTSVAQANTKTYDASLVVHPHRNSKKRGKVLGKICDMSTVKKWSN